jgi:thiamine transport system permease protein
MDKSLDRYRLTLRKAGHWTRQRLPQLSTRQAFALWILPLLFLAAFFFYPLLAIFRLVFATVGFSWQQIDWLEIWRPFSFTLWQAGLSTVLTLGVGIPSAYLFARFRFPGKRLLQVLTTLPFILPTVVVAAGFNAMLGPNGWINLGLVRLFHLQAPPIQFLNTLGAILLAHIFYNTTIIIRMVGGAWANLDTRLEQAARVLGASRWQTLREVTLPLLRPAILAASLLVFIFDFTSFGVVLLLGGPRFATLEVEIYSQAMHFLNLPMAGLLSLIQLLCTLVLTILYARLGSQIVPLAPRPQAEALRAPRRGLERTLIGTWVIVLALLLVSPLASLALRSVTRLDANRAQTGPVVPAITLAYYQELFINRRDALFYVPPIAAARNSLVYAGSTVVISLSLGFLAAYALRRKSPLNRWLDPLLMLPLGASAVTLGLGFTVVFNHPPFDLRSMPFLLPIAHSLVALPFVVRSLQPALAAIPEHLRQSAAVLGASPWRAWREVDLPVVSRAALGSAIFAFTISLGEFGATSFLARPEYPTLPVAIYRFISQPGALNYGQALAMSTLLMLVCSAGILAFERLNSKIF